MGFNDLVAAATLTFAGVATIWTIVTYVLRRMKDEELLKVKGKGKRSVVVTGAGSGIGLQTALFFAKKGWIVVAADVNEASLEKLQDVARDSNLSIETVPVDLSERAGCEALAEFVKEQEMANGLDCLVNCAGLAYRMPALGTSPDRIEKQLKVNLHAPILLSQFLLEPLLEGPRGGSIVNISSVSAIISFPYQGVYGATKFGLNGFTDALRRENMACKLNLRVSEIQPGSIWTPMVVDQFKNGLKWFEEEENKKSPIYDGWKAFTDARGNVEIPKSSVGVALLDPEDVAKAIYIHAVDPNPLPARVVATPLFNVMFSILRILPMAVVDLAMSRFA